MQFLVAECGIRQFLDIGTGLPAPENTLRSLRKSRPIAASSTSIAPLVLAHARALLTSTPQGSCDYVEMDLRDVSTILAGAAETLDLTRPAAVLLLAVLHFIRDIDDPRRSSLPWLGSSRQQLCGHLASDRDFAPGPVMAGVKAYNTLVPTTLVPRTHSQISALFAGLPMVPPGCLRCPEHSGQSIH